MVLYFSFILKENIWWCLVEMYWSLSFVSVVFDQEDENEGSDAEDEAGEGDHDGRDDLLDPDQGGDDGVWLDRLCGGEVGVERVEPRHGGDVTGSQESLQSE